MKWEKEILGVIASNEMLLNRIFNDEDHLTLEFLICIQSNLKEINKDGYNDVNCLISAIKEMSNSRKKYFDLYNDWKSKYPCICSHCPLDSNLLVINSNIAIYSSIQIPFKT